MTEIHKPAARTHPVQNYNLLKNATRRLIKTAGGVEGAAYVTRVGKTVLSDYQSLDRPSHFMPIDVAADLEADTGKPIVTQALAQIAGGVFIALPRTVNNQPMLAAHLAKIMRKTGKIIEISGDALADGKLCGKERDDIRAQIIEAMAALSSTYSFLESGEGGGNGQ